VRYLIALKIWKH